MPPCIDVYVWIEAPTPAAWTRFIAEHVDTEEPGGHRLESFQRVHVLERPEPTDPEVLAELGPGDGRPGGYTLYLPARHAYGASLTYTFDGHAVLGLSLNDPLGEPEALQQAIALAHRLLAAHGATAALVGTELPPPRSRAEWAEDGMVQHRIGEPAGR